MKFKLAKYFQDFFSPIRSCRPHSFTSILDVSKDHLPLGRVVFSRFGFGLSAIGSVALSIARFGQRWRKRRNESASVVEFVSIVLSVMSMAPINVDAVASCQQHWWCLL